MAPQESDAQAIIDAMKDLHTPQLLDVYDGTEDALSRTIIAVPKGMELRSVKPLLDEYLEKPQRRAGTATLGDLESFIAHVNRFKDPDTAIFAARSETAPSLTSVLDYHQQGPDNAAARFGKHRGVYKFPTSDAWENWRKVDGKAMNQSDFAEFLEDRILDLQMPPQDGRSEASALTLDLQSRLGGTIAGPTQVLDVARGLKVNEASEATNAITLSTGEVQVSYRTTHQAQTVGGVAITVPQLFLIGIPVFDGDAAYQMPIRLRYRKMEGRIIWTVIRYRPDLVFFDAFDRALAKVRTETDMPTFVGSPEA